MPSIGLGMMVKDEAQVITRALDSARQLVDCILIVDTGSTDNTKELAANWLDRANIPGKIFEEPWRDFGYGRSVVLKTMREEFPQIDYTLMLDADEVIKPLSTDEITALKENLTADCYNTDMQRSTIIYQLPRLTSNRLPFHYLGPAHEWLTCEKQPYSEAVLPGLTLIALGEGARQRNDPERYRREAALFEDILKSETDAFRRCRYTFYLAQSYRDAGEPLHALRAYWKRTEMGGWQEEVYVSLLRAASLHEQLGHSLTQILSAYKRAIALIPARAEAMHGAARVCRNAGLHGEGYWFAKQGVRLPLHKGLFVEAWVYEWGLLDEFAICAYYAGERVDGWLACQALLRGNLDPTTRERVEKNAEFCRA